MDSSLVKIDKLKVAQWLGFALGVAGALMLALNIKVSGWAYVIFVIADLCWVATALWKKIPALLAMHAIYILINVIGIYRWLYLQ